MRVSRVCCRQGTLIASLVFLAVVYIWLQTRLEGEEIPPRVVGLVGTSASSLSRATAPTRSNQPEHFVDGTPKCEGDMSSFIGEGGQLPVVLLAHQRPTVLNKTLQSLMGLEGFSPDRLLVAQDGNDRAVSNLLDEMKLHSLQHFAAKRSTSGDAWKIAANRIARHYKWSIEAGFQHFQSPGLIIVEDDLIFSPDFLTYFQATAPLLDCDPTLWVISAWNDNGFEHLVHDRKQLQRTQFMPGLGWLLQRKIWDNELAKKWPMEISAAKQQVQTLNWDHWMRDPSQHRGRSVLFPQMPRAFHNGSVGTFMDPKMHQRYFAKIMINQENISWKIPSVQSSRELDPDVLAAQYDRYEARVIQKLKSAHVPTSIAELSQLMLSKKNVLAVWIDVDPESTGSVNQGKFGAVARFFGMWHEAKRGAHRGMHELWWGETHIFLLNLHFKVGYIEGSWKNSPDDKCTASPAVSLNAIACDPESKLPCCSSGGWCGQSPLHCDCKRCFDFRKMLPNYRQLMPPTAKVFTSQDFASATPPARIVTRKMEMGCAACVVPHGDQDRS
eukprot:s595_g3.t1